MPFSAPFREPNIAPIFSPGGAVIPWYLLGGVTSAQCVAAYQPKGAADLASSKVNLAHPGTNDAAAGTNPSFATATGWTFTAASTQYLKTGVLPTSENWSLLVRVSSVPNTGSFTVCGSLDLLATKRSLQISIGGIDDTKTFYGNGVGASYIEAAPRLASGVLGIAAKTAYRNGAVDATIPAGTLTNALEIYLGDLNYNNAPYTGIYLTGSIQAFAIYNVTLNSTQVGLISTAMAAL